MTLFKINYFPLQNHKGMACINHKIVDSDWFQAIFWKPIPLLHHLYNTYTELNTLLHGVLLHV